MVTPKIYSDSAIARLACNQEVTKEKATTKATEQFPLKKKYFPHHSVLLICETIYPQLRGCFVAPVPEPYPFQQDATVSDIFSVVQEITGEKGLPARYGGRR